MGAVFTVTLDDVEVDGWASKLERLFHEEHLLDAIGALVVSQTLRRLNVEKMSPEGDLWAPWSDAYAATRFTKTNAPGNKGAQSLLIAHGDMRDSITHNVIMGGAAGEVEIGSSLDDPPYPAYHQEGSPSTGLPQRKWLGISFENQIELDRMVRHFVEDYL